MVARVVRLSIVENHMAYPADVSLEGRHDTISLTTLVFMLLVVLTSLLSWNQQVYHAPTKNVLVARRLLLSKLGQIPSGMRQSLILQPRHISILHRSLLVVQLSKLQHAKKKNTPL